MYKRKIRESFLKNSTIGEKRYILKIPLTLRSETTWKPDKYAFLQKIDRKRVRSIHTYTHDRKSKYSFCRAVKETMATVHGS